MRMFFASVMLIKEFRQGSRPSNTEVPFRAEIIILVNIVVDFEKQSVGGFTCEKRTRDAYTDGHRCVIRIFPIERHDRGRPNAPFRCEVVKVKILQGRALHAVAIAVTGERKQVLI